jgi:3-hydroxyisobutyrate dehydrogenase-like beta-hydroxyacid dehydrogenase
VASVLSPLLYLIGQRPQLRLKLFIVVAGVPDAVDACMPLFEAIGQKTFHFGENPPDASLVKLSGNFLITAVIEALSEAMALVGFGSAPIS